jgi:hypothetical protein
VDQENQEESMKALPKVALGVIVLIGASVAASACSADNPTKTQSASESTISATVIDTQTGTPLLEATATEQEQAHFMTTGPDGHFLLWGVASNTIVRITKPGYQTIELSASDVHGTIKMRHIAAS